MDSLNKETIQEITENLEYFQKQEKNLIYIENVKKELNQDYFKNDNKEKPTYVSNEL